MCAPHRDVLLLIVRKLRLATIQYPLQICEICRLSLNLQEPQIPDSISPPSSCTHTLNKLRKTSCIYLTSDPKTSVSHASIGTIRSISRT